MERESHCQRLHHHLVALGREIRKNSFHQADHLNLGQVDHRFDPEGCPRPLQSDCYFGLAGCPRFVQKEDRQGMIDRAECRWIDQAIDRCCNPPVSSQAK